MMEITKKKIQDVNKTDVLDGDLLLFRSKGLIAVAGRGIYSHAGKAMWEGDVLYCLEVREFLGGRQVTLESQAIKNPGRIDVYRAGDRYPEYDREYATKQMQMFIGVDYGWWNVITTAITHMFILRWFFRPSTNDQLLDLRYPPFCSQACSIADRYGGGVDPVPNLADKFTEPSDLARSTFYDYRFTLQ